MKAKRGQEDNQGEISASKIGSLISLFGTVESVDSVTTGRNHLFLN